MSILSLIVALLLSGASGVPAQTNVVSGGGPTSAPQTAGATTNPPSVDSVFGGGPTSGPQASRAVPGMTVDGVYGGGPTS